MIEYEEKLKLAIDLCIEIGAIKECEFHEGVYLDTENYSHPSKVTASILKEKLSALKFFENKAEMDELVEEAMASSGDECGYCEKNSDS